MDVAKHKRSVSSVHDGMIELMTILFIGYGIYTLNRKSVSLVIDDLVGSVLDKKDVGLIISWQNIAYAISKFIAGILSDRLSSRLLFSTGLFLSGLSTILFGKVGQSVALLSIVWFSNGFAQGLGWPACVKLIRINFARHQLATYWSVLSASSNVSGIVSPLLAAFITLNYGWRTTLVTFGLISILMSLITFMFIVDEKSNVKSSSNERKMASNFPLTEMLSSGFLWLISFSYLVVFAAKTTLCDWGQLYLIDQLEQSKMQASWFMSNIEMGGMLGSIMVGYVTDLMMSSNEDRSANDRLPIASALLLCLSISFHWLCFHMDQSTSPFIFCLVGFVFGLSLYGPIAIFGVMASESVPEDLSGTSHAIVALAANVGAVFSGLPLALMAEMFSWKAVFVMFQVITAFTALILILLKHRCKPNYLLIKNK